LLRAHLSPKFANEYFFIYHHGGSSPGYRGNLFQPLDAPKIRDWHEQEKLPDAVRWKTFSVIYSGGVFPPPITASKLRGDMRFYEAAMPLKQMHIPVGRPFSLGLIVNATRADGRSTEAVWPFTEQGVFSKTNWEVWLRIPPIRDPRQGGD